MPSRHRFARLALAALALSLLPSAAAAQNKARSVELGGFASFLRFDGETALSYRFVPSILVGYNFTKRHGIEAMGSFGSATPDAGPSFQTDVGIFRVGYTYNAYPKEKMVSLFRIGVGRWAIDPDRVPPHVDPNGVKHVVKVSAPEDNDQHFLFYLGGGVRFFIKEWLAIRVAGSFDVINTTGGIGKSDTQGTGDVGLVFLFGGRETPAEEPSAAPADGEEPKKEKPKEEKPKEEKPEEEVKPPQP
jgi:hypothetical protein